ncbi:D(1)-like dopamine receptor [Oculina patagonica]
MGGSFDSSRTASGFTASPPGTVSTALQTAVLSLTFVANFLGNICVCLAISRARSLRQKPSSSILASLAVSDFSLLSFLLFRLIWLYDFEAANKACEHFLVLLGALSYVSICHICLLSCDRYIAIIYPLRYKAILTTTRVKLALLVSWGAPVISIVVLPLFYGDSDSAQFRTSIIGCSESTDEPSLLHKIHLVFNFTLFVAIPFVVLLLVYGHIAKISWFQSNRVEPGENLNPETAELRRKKRKDMKWMKTIGKKSLTALKMLFFLMVIGAFAFCYIPAFVCILVTAKLGPSRVPNALHSTVVVMITINSALNPIIYMLRSNDFKRAYKKIFRGASVEPSNATGTARTGVTLLGATTCTAQIDLPSVTQ